MFKSWLRSLQNKFRNAKGAKRPFFPGLQLLPLEERINPAPTVSVSYDSVTGTLVLDSNALVGESSSYESFQSAGTIDQQKILNFRATPGFSTTFNSVAPLVFVNPLTNGSGYVQVDTRNLANFQKIIFQGSQGNDTFVLGNMDGNVLGDVTKANFGFEVDVLSTQGGASLGVDSLQVNGAVTLKGDGNFTTDANNTVITNLNLETVLFSAGGSINSIGSGLLRIIADGSSSSVITLNQGSGIDIGSGSVFLKAGSNGSIQLNGNAINTDGGFVDLRSNVIIQSTTFINTGLGDATAGIGFSGSIQGVSSGGENLYLDTTGNVTISGDSGNINLPLGSIYVGTKSLNTLPLGFSLTNAYAKSITSVSQGAFTSSGILNLNYVDGLNVTTTSSVLGTVTLGSTTITSSSVNTTSNGTVTINNAGLLQVYGGLSLDGQFIQNGSGGVSLGNNLGVVIGGIPDFSITTSSDQISFSSGITLTQSSVFSSNISGLAGQGADITLNSTLDGFYPAKFTAGTGNILFGGKIGSVTPLSSIGVLNVNKLTSNASIVADSLTVTVANNEVVFNGTQSYSQTPGLSINTNGNNSNVIINQPVNCFNNAQIDINNSGILITQPAAVLSTQSGYISLGGTGGGNIYLNADLSSIAPSGSGGITFFNPVSIFNPITITVTDSVVDFKNTIDSGGSVPQNLTLQGLQNLGSFAFASSVGSKNSLGNIRVISSGGLTFSSTLNASGFTIDDGLGLVLFANNVSLTGTTGFTATNASGNQYAISFLGLNNQISGAGTFSNAGVNTLGNSNAASFLFSKGILETGGGGFVAQGTFLTGSDSGISIDSPFTVNGNNTGVVSLDVGLSATFKGTMNVQANERIIKNGPGSLRLISNTGQLFRGNLVANQGTVTFVDDFSSIDYVNVSGGAIAGTGKVGRVFGYSGSILPGDSVGKLTTGNISLNQLMTLGISIITTPLGTNDALAVNGNVSLNNTVLALSVALPTTQVLSVGNVFTILENDGSDPIAGTFLNLPSGSSISSGVYTFRISYTGGTNGNDVTLTVTSAVTPPVPAVEGIQQIFVTAADAGGGPLVTVNYPNGKTYSFFAYDPSFRGGVRIAMGDVNGDNYTDLVTAVGVGGAPHIKIWNLNTNSTMVPVESASFYAFESSFTGGLYLGLGNLNGDPYADIIVGAGPGGGPRVSVFAGAPAFSINQNQVLVNFFAYDEAFRGGVTVAAADRTGDGIDEIVTGAGYGGAPNVTVFQLQNTAPNQFNPLIIQNFYAFDTAFTGGVYVAGGRFSNSTYDDIFVGTGPGTKATVAVAFGTGGFYYLTPFGEFTGGARVGISSSAATAVPSGTNYLMAAAGPGGGPRVSLFQYGTSSNNVSNISQIDSFFALNPYVTVGVFANTTIL